MPSRPPMHSMMRMSAMPSLASSSVNPSMTSCVWRASSREGQMIRPTGPSMPASGMRCSSIMDAMIMGSTNVSDLPEPVKAMPMMSRPDRMTGRPWIWMGVGLLMPFFVSWFRMGSGNFISLNVRMGGGISVPSTMMCHLSRTSTHSSSVMLRMCMGGFHPVSMDCVYLMSLECSDADISAFFSVTFFRIAASSSAIFCAGVTFFCISLSPAARDSSDVVSF
mmetsp:Transcript_17671/g.43698  ORF Transcript_17671/g.43698 Transcript_17671/m.43698 type:complete len:222 (+) Transcript_17671:568-1233(+)